MDLTAQRPPEAVMARIRSQMIHVMLTLVVAGIVHQLTHRWQALFMIPFTSWLSSIYMFAGGALPFWRILAAVVFNGVIFYLLCRFVLPA